MLNIGIFFDGTGNNRRDTPGKRSNIAKLSTVYRSDDPDKYACLYVRGVGSKAITKRDKELGDKWYEIDQLGGAFGQGGQDRIDFILGRLDNLLAGYKQRNGKLPAKIVFDVFGFSRGAALARNFVNVIYLKKYPQPALKKVSQKRVRFLGIYDTVGSFGLPGNKKDPGYNFHINTQKVQYGYHLISEDELRENFDLQTIKPSLNMVLDSASAKGKSRWMIEEAFPGVHSDLGGGYGKNKEHGCANNELARIYLKLMFDKARTCGVPLISTPSTFKQAGWKVPAALQKKFKQLMGYYAKYPGLSEKHKVLRANQRHLEILKKELPGRMAREARFSVARGVHVNIKSLVKQKLSRFEKNRVQSVKDLISREVFQGKKAHANSFFTLYQGFRSSYIHTSHFPHNKGIGMDPQKQNISENEWPLNSAQFSTSKQKYYSGLKRHFKRKVYTPDISEKNDMNTIRNLHSLTCHLKIMVKTKKMKKAVPLPKNGYVRVWDDDLFANDKLGAADMQSGGRARIFCFDIGDNKDIFFTLHTKGARVPGKKIPAEWDSRDHWCMKDKRYTPDGSSKHFPGIFEEFKGRVMGNKKNPLILYLYL